jgi:hypothetical protein
MGKAVLSVSMAEGDSDDDCETTHGVIVADPWTVDRNSRSSGTRYLWNMIAIMIR